MGFHYATRFHNLAHIEDQASERKATSQTPITREKSIPPNFNRHILWNHGPSLNVEDLFKASLAHTYSVKVGATLAINLQSTSHIVLWMQPFVGHLS